MASLLLARIVCAAAAWRPCCYPRCSSSRSWDADTTSGRRSARST